MYCNQIIHYFIGRNCHWSFNTSIRRFVSYIFLYMSVCVSVFVITTKLMHLSEIFHVGPIFPVGAQLSRKCLKKLLEGSALHSECLKIQIFSYTSSGGGLCSASIF